MISTPSVSSCWAIANFFLRVELSARHLLAVAQSSVENIDLIGHKKWVSADVDGNIEECR